MPTPDPPFDRAVALACTMATLRGRHLHVRCGCGASQGIPVRFMLQEQPSASTQTLADVVVRVRCKACRGRPRAVYLAEDARGPGPLSGSVEPGWSVLLHGVAARA